MEVLVKQSPFFHQTQLTFESSDDWMSTTMHYLHLCQLECLEILACRSLSRRILNAMKIRKMLTLNYEIDIHIVFFAFSEDFKV